MVMPGISVARQLVSKATGSSLLLNKLLRGGPLGFPGLAFGIPENAPRVALLSSSAKGQCLWCRQLEGFCDKQAVKLPPFAQGAAASYTLCYDGQRHGAVGRVARPAALPGEVSLSQ